MLHTVIYRHTVILFILPYRYTVTSLCKAISIRMYIKNGLVLSKFYLCELNDCHMTCNLSQYKIITYPLAVIYLISSWNIKLFNHSPARVVVMGRPVHRITSIASSSSHLSYKIYTYVLYLKQLSISASRPA